MSQIISLVKAKSLFKIKFAKAKINTLRPWQTRQTQIRSPTCDICKLKQNCATAWQNQQNDVHPVFIVHMKKPWVLSYSLGPQTLHNRICQQMSTLFALYTWIRKTSRDMTKPTKWVCAQRRQISLGIQVFAICMKKAWVRSYPLSAQQRLWSDWVDAQADLSLRWAHTHFVGFVMG